MSDFGKKVKSMLVRSAKFVGSSAKQLVKETKYKANELGDLGKRRDLINELGEKVYQLNQPASEYPEEISSLIKQLAMIDQNLAILRADHAAQKAEAVQQRAAQKAARAAEKAAAKAATAIEKSTASVTLEIQNETVAASASEIPHEQSGISEEHTQAESETAVDNTEALN